MKLIKFSFLFLVAIILVETVSVFAGNTIPSTGIVPLFAEIPAGKTITFSNYTKGSDLNAQSYQFNTAKTTITNPCPSCKFKITLYNGKNNQLGSVTGKTGDNIYFDSKYNNVSAAPGDYHISVKRDQVTAVTSVETGNWYIAKANPKAVFQN